MPHASTTTSTPLSSEPFSSLLFHSNHNHNHNHNNNKNNNKNEYTTGSSCNCGPMSTSSAASSHSIAVCTGTRDNITPRELVPEPIHNAYRNVDATTATTTTRSYCGCTRSNCLYLIGSCLYVYLAIWDIHNEQSWYDSPENDPKDSSTSSTSTLTVSWNTTSINNNTASTTDENDSHNNNNNNNSDLYGHHHYHSSLLSFLRMVFPKIDLYLFVSILAASCYVLDALLCLIQTCRWTPPQQLHCMTNDDTTFRQNAHRVARNDDHDNSNGILFIPHRFQPTTNIVHHKNTTRMMALTFGLGATLDLVAASTTEMDQYPYISTGAVVGAAHFYLINAVYVVVASTNKKIFCCRTGLSTSQLITFVADRLFLVGSIVDVALSYFYIGENWDSNITVWVYIYRGYLFSSLLWLLNAIMYIVADIGMDHSNKMFHHHSHNHNVLLDDTSSRAPNVESTTVVSPKKQQVIMAKQRFESRYYSHNQYDSPRNIDPGSLLLDHSLSLHETTRMTTAATEPLPDDTTSVTTSTTSTLSFLHG